MGFRYRARTIRYEGDAGSPFEGLWIEVTQVRTGAEYTALAKNEYWIDLHPVMAPFVVGWNLDGVVADPVERDAIGAVVDAHTAYELTYAPLPPPAEAGPDVFDKVPVEVKQWIHRKLLESIFYRDDDGGATRAKGKASSNPSAPTPAGAPNTTAVSTEPKRRRAPKSSSGRSNAT